MVELLVAIAIIGILMSLLLPAVQAAREAARRTQCANQLKQLGLAAHNYHDVYRMLPLGNDWKPSAAWGGWDFNAGVHVRLLPYLDQTPLQNQIDFNVPLLSIRNLPIINVPMPNLLCPSDTGDGVSDFDPGDLSPVFDESFQAAFTNYVASVGPVWFPRNANFDAVPAANYYRGLFWEDHSNVRFRDVTDGLSTTLMFSERSRGVYPIEEQKWWGWWSSGYAGDTMFGTMHPVNTGVHMKVLNSTFDFVRMMGCASSLHPGGAQFCLADGSVRFVSESLDSWNLSDGDLQQLWDTGAASAVPGLYQALSSRNGGEVTGEF